MHSDLTGNCDPDLAGKHIRFKVRRVPPTDFDEHSIANFQIRQIGPAGKMTAALKVRVDASGDPLPPGVESREPGQWKDCLHLEWFGQNGRAVVTLIDPVIQVVGPAEKDGADAFFGDVMPDRPQAESAASPGPESDPFTIEDDPDERPEGLSFTPVPGDRQRDLDRKAAAVDRAVLGDDDIRKDIGEMELMDDLIEHGVGVSLTSIIDATGPLPAPESLNENQAWCVLKVLLARLAVQGIAVDMCEHVTGRDTYRLLREEIGHEAHCFRELRGTGWVQHFSTHEFCKACDEEFEREWRESHPPGEAEGGGSANVP